MLTTVKLFSNALVGQRALDLILVMPRLFQKGRMP